MSVPPPDSPPAATAQDGQQPADGQGVPEPPKLRRRPMLIALSVLLTALGALLGAWVLTGLSGTESYIAVREDVERGQQIEASDLVQTQLRTDSAVQPVPWDLRRSVIDGYAAVDLSAGGLVTPDSVTSQYEPAEGQSVVSLALEPGQVPAAS